MLVKICTSGGDTLPLSPLLKCITHTSLCSHPLFGLHTHSTSITECQQVPFFSQGGIQFHASTSYKLPHQMPFYQTAPLLPFITEQRVMEYWREGSTSTAIPPPSASNVMALLSKQPSYKWEPTRFFQNRGISQSFSLLMS